MQAGYWTLVSRLEFEVYIHLTVTDFYTKDYSYTYTRFTTINFSPVEYNVDAAKSETSATKPWRKTYMYYAVGIYDQT